MFDQGTPVPLRKALTGHQIETAYEMGWSMLENGELLSMAESEGFEVLITTDQNLQYQQDLTSRQISIIVLSSPSWPRIRKIIPAVQSHLDAAVRGNFVLVSVP